MACLRTHKIVGAASGAVYAGYKASNQPGSMIEMIGGGVGGYWGGILPDQLEPALSSWHRNGFHSATAGGGVIYASNMLSDWATACRLQAERYRAVQTVRDPITGAFLPVPINLFQKLAELFWSFLAGVLNGFCAGYVSHLALDAVTPRGIPLLGSI